MVARFTDELRAKLSPRLATHLDKINIGSLSRISVSRLLDRALPNIACIELVAGSDFVSLYDDLYISMFPNQLERERSELIVLRLDKEYACQRDGLAPYRVVGLRDNAGRAIGAAQFSVLMLSGLSYAVPYLQYIYVRKEYRRQDMAELLHTMVLAIASADAIAHDKRHVPFTLFETEPTGHGTDDGSQAVATQRAMIHAKSGAVAIMLQGDNEHDVSSPHVQPGLEPDDPPLSLVWAIRASPAVAASAQTPIDIETIGLDLVAAYYQSLRDEEFPEVNIRLAETIVAKRCKNRNFVVMPLCDVELLKNDKSTFNNNTHEHAAALPVAHD